MNFRADLHIHTNNSDGTLSAEQILELAKQNNLSAISITDHDTIKAYNKDLFDFAKKLNIQLVPGVEISSEFLDTTVHILAYNFDLSSKDFLSFLKKVQKKRILRNAQILKKLKEHGIAIEEKELQDYVAQNNIAQAVIGRMHIAQLMDQKGFVKSVQDAFDKYIKDEACCYVKGNKFSPIEVIDAIHKAKGRAVLAHPFVFKQSLLNKLLKFDFDGIEVYYAKLLPSQENIYLKIANKKNLLITGGSDFHGTNKPYISLGCSWIDDINLNKLLNEKI